MGWLEVELGNFWIAPLCLRVVFLRESGRVDEDRPRPDGTDASGPALSNLETHYSHKTSKGDD
jgi:hypothetical protein